MGNLFYVLFVSVFYLSINSSFAESFSTEEAAKECATKIGEVPDVDCNRDGTIVPITINGKEVVEIEERNGTKVARMSDGTELPGRFSECDRPHQLDGGCYPFSRIVRLSKGDVEAAMFCRRKEFLPKDSEVYGDVALILKNKKTGETCFYQSFPNVGKIPAPFSSHKTPEENRRGISFWGSPSTSCTSCHDADPWIHSAFIDQVSDKNSVPSSPLKPYKVLDPYSRKYSPTKRFRINLEAYDKKFPPTDAEKQKITTGQMAEANACTACHFMGPGSYSAFAKNAMLNGGSRNLTPFAKQFPNGVWMPPDVPDIADAAPPHEFRKMKDLNEYLAYYKRAIDAMEACVRDPELAFEEKVGERIVKTPICTKSKDVIEEEQKELMRRLAPAIGLGTHIGF